MKTFNEIQEQIEKLENIKVELKKQIIRMDTHPIRINMEKQYDQIDNDIKTLKWVLNNN